MRRSAITAAALAAALVLAGCSSDDGDAEPTATETETGTQAPDAGNAPEDVAALEGITVEGEAGAAPTLGFEQPLSVTGPAAVLSSAGDGEEIVEGQLLLVHVTQVNGENGEELSSTYEDAPQPLVVSDEVTVPAVVDVLVGQQVGARVLFATPAQEAAAISVLEVVDARVRAEGAAVELPAGVPAVTLADSGEPSIEPVDGEAPTELVVAPTIQGEGDPVEEGDYVHVQYSGWLWDGTPFDSSWSRGAPFALQAGAGQVIEGWDTGLLGQNVGSQVVMVIPPELGYGDQDNGTIPPGSTLVFVVDILDAY
ncbi:FKBP-type peptidyl-prolyl cis-trans isomerase [Georgenia phoenicis]|uniref:FKBP-type peptidyl-prolyl cis-trans isomerase n=1 Tax=unclassified Georgenia TaxID=2626815 RepID=UPI0039AEB518